MENGGKVQPGVEGGKSFGNFKINLFTLLENRSSVYAYLTKVEEKVEPRRN